MNGKKGIIVTGGIIGLVSVALVYFGNPANMGYCIACFLRDIAGGIGLHRAGVVQYIRPEIMGLVLGAFLLASKNGEFESRGGSSPFTRFILGIAVMIGALMFLGCPMRMVLRLGGGDLNAIFGLVGFTGGILAGVFFLNRGFNLKRNYKMTNTEGYVFPAVNIGLIILVAAAPAFIFFSEKGPGALHAPMLVSLAAGLLVGGLSQKTRLCMVGGMRDMILFRDSYLLMGFVSIIAFAAVGNLLLGNFNLGFESQPVAHTDGLWNMLGMVLVGWASVLLGGCPLRQLILAGEGNTDSAVTVMGLIFGAALCHNFGLAASPKGPSVNGQVAVIACLLIVGAISLLNSELVSASGNKDKSKGDVKNA